ncbi:testis-specific serine/threonine-protein kinase 3-like [Euwallacea similis]|uniref:testis-specific serine/threonine-protein kinase 3-like n=1 Tax=Euwallacea similis TaxID=1736056 RepID=UPI00344D6F0E
MAKELLLRASEEKTLAVRGYRLLKKLGEGSYSYVYLTEFVSNSDEKQNRYLACKVVDVSKAPKDFVKKFLPRELDILVRLNHPHIIHIHSVFQRKTKYFVFMRNAENGDLLEYVLKKGPVSEAQARVWIRQLALAVQYLHGMDIAHRDLKCENCLITANYNLKLADFGFARFVMDSNGKQLLSNTYCGSLSYTAPEVLRGMPYYPRIADMWSCGVIIYVCINKAMPFDDTNVKKLYEHQVSRRWKFRSKVVDSLSEEVKQLVINLLEPDTNKRWKIDHIVKSDWIGLDSRFNSLTKAEENALSQAFIERRIYLEGLNRKNKDAVKLRKEIDDVKVLKPTTYEKHFPHVDIQSTLTITDQ